MSASGISDDELMRSSPPPPSPTGNNFELPPQNSQPGNDGLGAGAGEGAENGQAAPAIVQPDWTQYAHSVATTLQLTTEYRHDLVVQSQLGHINQAFVSLGGLLFSVKQQLDRLHPPQAAYTMPAALTNAIDVKAAELFLSSDLSAYKEWPNKKLMTQLKADGNIPAGVSRDKAANKLIGRYIGSKFIHYRNDTKDLIGQSMGIFNDTLKKFDGPSWGIYELTEKIIDTVTSTGVVVSITLPFVARVAFLRYLYAAKLDESMNGKVPSDFWDCIDAKLVKIREEKKDAAKITKVFQHALTKDRHRFGDAAATVSINAFMLSAEAQGNRVAAAPAPVAGPSSSS
ncbi:hypothetical protein BDZ89DRAFT_1179856 [Hymenopellis radicata]|nr:hypothetical protein BDZ89DRAFT_1179856 [Hymenopellis radicata]